MNTRTSTLLNKTLREFILHYFYLILLLLLSFLIVYWYLDVISFMYLFLAGFIFHIMFFIIPLKLDYTSLKPFISTYFIALTLFISPFVIVLLNEGESSPLSWYIIIPFGISILYSYKTTIYWIIYIFLIILFCIFIPVFFNIPHILNLTQADLYLVNLTTIFFNMSIVSLLIYYNNKINTIKKQHILQDDIKVNEISNDIKPDDNILKYKELYEEILNYMDAEKPYCSPDFTTSQLANSLNSNVTYISRAIKQNANTHFNIFINKYRIEMVKKLIEEDHHNKYTLKHIHTSVGFRHQSTFNKAFKQIEGITPSEYIKEISNFAQQDN